MTISRRYLQFIRSVSRNRIGKMGVVLTTSTFLMFIFMEFAWFVGLVTNAYIGLISYLVLPLLFLFGLAMIPLGWKRQQQITGKTGLELLSTEFGEDGIKAAITGSHIFKTVGILTLINVLFLILASTQTLHFMDEAEFCGTACHSVMNPEWQTYQVSSHANVKCVSCHVGEGAEALFESKLNGLWQMVSVSFNLYERPIPTPVRQLRPARETCEKCHWPEKHYGEQLIKRIHYTNDEIPEALYTTLSFKVDADMQKERVGVHWHIARGVKVSYASVDDQRSKIKWVKVDYPDGSSRQFQNKRLNQDTPILEERQMDCVDCHNRATHVYREPEDIVDGFLADGIIPLDLPFIRREALDALQTHSPDKSRGVEQVRKHLFAYYQENYPDIYFSRQVDISNTSDLLAAEYDRYIHPNMNIEWGVYPSQLGHKRDDGCFRCHHENMQDDTGKDVDSDCTVCHDIFAFDSKFPYQYLSKLDTFEVESAIHKYLQESRMEQY
ncbi:MAG: hypothetical protein HOD43_13440 [Candidatus Marinimicrobia bacterium]|jgi:hypothetical protein|nr:hypothetical protein [Candidatus Neomarinimicrobiota bacterium]MBT3629774.1 hypothetical protein [Candidatus Neomarinimicrobiota bacterium]MBT3825656.1 hypothetical protein [Candidatus Neomarinimicrobiota bacterium]MBT4132498.1 hypothetical protein [Candidatus Neomarinimicrobiota bacterium]MBT4296797.1 hypothetical protein [Candidatus Neomarinimicrobiota bacterium]